jgi:sulfate adenylyltransferase
MTKPGDVDHFTRVRCYEAVLDKYPHQTTALSLLNLAMRMAGPREAVWHGLIRKNHGCTHMIVGRDHAGPGKNSQGKDFYDPYAAQELFGKHAAEIGIEMVDFKHMVYVQEKAQYFPANEDPGRLDRPRHFRHRTAPPPARGAGYPGMVQLPGSGERTAQDQPRAVEAGLHRVLHRAFGQRQVHHRQRADGQADGDGRASGHASGRRRGAQAPVVGTRLLEGTPRPEHQADRLCRASEITKNGGIAICAPIAPYTATRRAVREMVEAFGAFVETHVATSLEECERRDRKGLYKLAREGKIKEFTGISDPYEAPTNAELVVDTENVDVDHCAHQVLLKLEQMGLIKA